MTQEYLISYGLSGDFGRFRTPQHLSLQRGDRVIVRTHRGVEAGAVLTDAQPGHALHLPNTTVGHILRTFDAGDEQTEARHGHRRRELFQLANGLKATLAAALEVVDVELLHDGTHAVLHHVRAADYDVREFVSRFSRESGLHVLLADLAAFADAPSSEENLCEHCGSPGGGCGSDGGGCGSCNSKNDCHSHGVEADEHDRVTLL